MNEQPEASRTIPPDAKRVASLERFSKVAGALVAIAGAVVLLGWAIDAQVLTTGWAETVSMKPNTAVCFLVGGLALAVPRPRVRFVGGCIIALIGAATILEDALQVDLHIDSALFNVGPHPTARMAPMTAAAFIAIGTATVLLGKRTRIAHALSCLAIAVAFVALTGHILGVSSLFRVSAYSTMALHTSIAFIALGVAVLAHDPAGGLTLTFTNHGAGGLMVRRVLPLAIVLPLVSTWVAHEGVRLGWYEERFALSIDVVATVIILSALIWWTAQQMYRLDSRRYAAEEDLRTLNVELEHTIERRTAELAASEGFYRVLSESITDLVIHMSADGKITYASPAVGSMLGYAPEEMVGHTAMDFLPPDSADDMTELYGHVLNGLPATTRQHVFRKDGSQVWLEGVANPVTDNTGVVRRIIWIIRDVTENIDAMQRLREVADRERELSQLKNEFVGIVAHDLKSPLTVIAGFADILLAHWDTSTPEERADFLERIRDNTHRLSQMIDDVLQVSRIESGEIVYQLEDFDLGTLLEQTCEDVTSSNPGRVVHRSVPADLPLAHGDRDRTWRIVTNLLSNALKFSEAVAPVDVCAKAETDHIEVAITDHGFGIREDDMPRLFQRFSRVQQPAGKRVKGTGLGLYISRSLVEGQGGRIWADSELGKGTTFRFTVPRAGVTT